MDEFGDEWQGVSVWYSPLVQLSVVLHWSEFAILLLDEEESARIGRFRSADSLQPEVGGEELLLLFPLFW